ncbi:hypothetical protein [Roseinatronobacter alkalisoli]|uniref:Sulfotransferase family protein n=1 Tax=Roseinatronobacter alkalisoli TaxID=3028235 RepID=A0ABT5T7I8_9RHOB|nr:hypothetical protein [Roseinatronobacter sp. HJB301]MDD7969918.1 hypothetical protein [Roseinatronobacter sp. HJB301]
MDIALHLGAHLTDEGRLLRCLSKNHGLLADQGIEVPEHARYRDLLLGLAQADRDAPLGPDAGQVLLDSLLDGENPKRLILSEPDILAWPGGAARKAHFYPAATHRLQSLREAFADENVMLFLAIRNPASFLPALLNRVKRGQAEKILKSIQPEKLRWSAFIQSLRTTWPEAQLTVWCDEDTPFIWHKLLQEVGGCDPQTQLAHSFDWFNEVMIAGGAEKLEAYLTATPPVDDTHRQRVIGAFLDKFYDESKVDVDVSITGWDAERVDLLSALYDEDVVTLSALDGVSMIQP